MVLEHVNWKLCIFLILIHVNVIGVVFYGFNFQYGRYQKQQVFSPLRVFIFTSDNRPIINDQNAYNTLTALTNFAYARRYNYTYRYFQLSYNDSRNFTKKYPFRPGCFNQNLNQERSVHWAKLQVIWHVLETYSSTYDLFLYLDSDAVFNNHNLSISTLFAHLSWRESSRCKDFHINSCHLAFFADSWRRPDGFVLPNSGIFLFQPTFQFRQFLQLWWHLNFHEANFFGTYEQDSLWNLLADEPSLAAREPTPEELAARRVWNTKIKDTLHHQNLKRHVGILNMKTFGKKIDQSQFFVHMTSGVGIQHRHPKLLSIWQRIEKTTLNYNQLFIEIEKQCVVKFDATNDRIPLNISVSS